MLKTGLLLIVIFFVPYLIMLLSKRISVLNKLGNVFLCYVCGILLSFPLRHMNTDMMLASDVSSVLVCVAMPLILFSADLSALRKLAGPMLKSFGLNIVSVILIAGCAFYVFAQVVPDTEIFSAMLIGTYTGGTPNMFAIGHGMGASAEQIMITQTSDMIAGGIYFFLLISIMPALLRRFMPEYRFTVSDKSSNVDKAMLSTYSQKANFAAVVKVVLLALLCAVLAMGICLLLPSKYENTGLAKLSEYTAVIMLLVTTFGILLSFSKKVRYSPGSYNAGQSCILMFSIAMGLCFDLSSITAAMAWVFVMIISVQFGTIILHIILAKIFRVDYHTAMITSTAGVFGPAFIIPVAKALKNDDIILPGILCGILGYAVGNYLGIGFGNLLILLG